MNRLLPALVLILVACTPLTPQVTESPSASAAESPCQLAVRLAAAIEPSAETDADLDHAIALCDSIEELTAAAELYPDAFDGVPVREFAEARCELEPELQPEPVCQAVRTP